MGKSGDPQETRRYANAAVRERARELRRPQTPAENRLWAHLRDRQLAGYKFRRQHPLGRFIADFYCAACRLILELDGESHQHQGEYDAERTVWLQAAGYYVLRFPNDAVYHHLGTVLESIQQACQTASVTPVAAAPESIKELTPD
ncbi:MAG TPA: endonuclease domain-containing protein [Chloroflexia bacterium]|nr:endonuclease domain-containing protein [Chloroflexia bacterium]